MQVIVTGRHMGVSESLREYCVEKAGRLSRFLNTIQSVEIILDGKAGVHSAEMIVHNSGTQPFVAHEERGDAFAAIDLTLDKIEEQLRRHKERLHNRKHPPHAADEPRAL